MTEPFLISDDRLRTLSATRQGRVSIAGYNYQAAYAVARLASMSVRQPVLDLGDWPQKLRYDWGEDLDEVCDGSIVVFTQCKRVESIGQPASLADVLTGFSPKWLWVPESERSRLRFRLVCSDSRFAAGGTSLSSLKAGVHSHFLKQLKEPPGPHSDRAVWIADADSVGHDVLFEALWGGLDCLYLPADVVDSEPAGPRLAAEKEALRVLLERGQIDPSEQDKVLGRLRRLVHDNLISFDPTNDSLPLTLGHSPRRLDRADVNAAIDLWRPASHRQPPFQLVDRTFLSETRELERQQFVARQPDWSDVAHGHDDIIKFIERDQTEALETAVLEKVVARIGRGGKLPTLFVAGAPGDGKTTIARRVAARLVDAGKVLIADTGLGLQEPPGEPDEYVQAIERLQSFGRPVVLLLDDPLYAESPWLDVLKKLNRPGLRVGVVAATPQFLFDEHGSQLRWCDVSTFEMARTSQTERQSLAALYGRSVSSKPEEDFLVVAMEAAAGVPFREIIERLWLTLADGRDLSSARNLSDLPWQSRAYLFVCFFSRIYEACPEPLLLKLLEMTGGLSDESDMRTELQRMRHFAGWRIFRTGQRARVPKRERVTRRAKDIWISREALVAAAHVVIARQAWKQRPLPWCDVSDMIIESSVSIPRAISDVANLGVRLQSASFAASTISGTEGDEFLTKLIERWRHDSNIETRAVCDLVFTLSVLGGRKFVRPFRNELIRRCRPDSQGWLAAMQLWFLAGKNAKHKEFGVEVDALSLIQSADFSINPKRASQFGTLLKPNEPLWNAFVVRLLDALDGNLLWNIDGTLVTCLLIIAPFEQLIPRVAQIMSWLAAHPEDTYARTQFMSFLLRLPSKFSSLRVEVAQQTAKWLEEHPDDHQVRTKYLSFLHRLPAECSNMRLEAARQTAKWLATHPQDGYARTQFMSFLLRLPSEFSDLRAETARQTAQWLTTHPEDAYVRVQFMSFLSAIWKHRDGTARTMAVDEWQRFARATLEEVTNLAIRPGWQRRRQALIESSRRLHLALLQSLKLSDSDEVRETLEAYDVLVEWCVKNPSSERDSDFSLLHN